MQNRRFAFRRFHHSGHLSHWLEYKRLDAIARRTTKQVKKDSWRRFCSSVNQQTSLKEIWQKAEAFRTNARTQSTLPPLDQLNQFADTQAPPYAPEYHEIHPELVKRPGVFKHQRGRLFSWNSCVRATHD